MYVPGHCVCFVQYLSKHPPLRTEKNYLLLLMPYCVLNLVNLDCIISNDDVDVVAAYLERFQMTSIHLISAKECRMNLDRPDSILFCSHSHEYAVTASIFESNSICFEDRIS